VKLKSEHYADEFFDATDMGEGDFFIFDVNKKTYGPWYNAYLYISYRNPDGSWTAPKNMGDMINRGEGRFPSFSPDGRYLFFTSYRTGQAGYYWVDAQIIDYLQEHDLDLVAQLTQTVANEGVAAARRRWEQKRAEHGGYYAFDHRLFDDVGDELVQLEKRDAAVEVLCLNQELYPETGSLLRRIKLAALHEDEAAMARLQPELAAGAGPDEDDLNRWGRFLTRCGYHQGAVLVFELNPRSAEAHVGLGAVHKGQGDLDAARESLETALKLDPDNAKAKRLLGEIEG